MSTQQDDKYKEAIQLLWKIEYLISNDTIIMRNSPIHIEMKKVLTKSGIEVENE